MNPKLKEKSQKFHFIGIGGSGMSGIAQICLDEGYSVSGSDLKQSEITNRLCKRGAVINFPHSKNHVKDEPVVVVSSAIPEANEELVFAKNNGLTVKKRAEVLGWFMSSKIGISVAGCHGKTTTTSMVSAILIEANLDPTTIVGGEAFHVGGNAKFGKGEHLIAEADESDGSFLYLPSTYSIVTNVDNDHLDFYGDFENIKLAFRKFINQTKNLAIVFGDDTFFSQIKNDCGSKVRSYGFNEGLDYQIKNITFSSFGSSFSVFKKDKLLTEITLQVPGFHNALNATASFALAYELGIEPKVIAKALASFSGVQRRFERVSEKEGILVLDDYAHHPTEIKATLLSAKRLADNRGGLLVVAFQPHRFTRLKHLIQEFSKAFALADYLYLASVYSAGEASGGAYSSLDLYRHLDFDKARVEVLEQLPFEVLSQKIKKELRNKDVFLTIGAGNITRLSHLI